LRWLWGRPLQMNKGRESCPRFADLVLRQEERASILPHVEFRLAGRPDAANTGRERGCKEEEEEEEVK